MAAPTFRLLDLPNEILYDIVDNVAIPPQDLLEEDLFEENSERRKEEKQALADLLHLALTNRHLFSLCKPRLSRLLKYLATESQSLEDCAS